ncbi:probable protein phosphatase 2C 60 isoform X3 [Salvia miltiorrhiza]|uniref:probable protein phosphatase 2C 60 isoform X3 n=1 Tax=Salvia miltiorrhiza TaxID=226208 RepID=UPI0025AC2130|nr:probable protein phosphatase 2C 60 isoform X3 [Salvia miltiorrhiza]
MDQDDVFYSETLYSDRNHNYRSLLSQLHFSPELEMGVYLSTPKTGKASEDGENDRLRYGLSSMQGWRATMEDAHAAFTNLDDSTSFFGVYDGHGGNEVSKFCAKFLHQQVLNDEAYATGDLENSVRKAFLRMDEMMCGRKGQKELELLRGKVDQSTSNGENLQKTEEDYGKDVLSSDEGTQTDYSGPSSGSTACIAIIRNNQLLVANAGDSRCVMSRKGKAYELSKDHKPDHATEKKRILDAGGYVQYGRVNGSLNLSRAIGDMELKQNRSLPAEKQIVTANPDIIKVDLSEDDEFLIVACDGIWDCMSSEQTVDFVKQQLNSEKKLSVVCERVLDRCLAPASGQEGCDNMTMILVQFKKPLGSKPSSTEPVVPSLQ